MQTTTAPLRMSSLCTGSVKAAVQIYLLSQLQQYTDSYHWNSMYTANRPCKEEVKGFNNIFLQGDTTNNYLMLA